MLFNLKLRLRSWLFAERTMTLNVIWRYRKGMEDTVELVSPDLETLLIFR
uniref:Phage tail protein n=1 Tax=Heterorhabditis bacteriophora TaxID=37862 RepID=A0A1I7WAS7_HETBA